MAPRDESETIHAVVPAAGASRRMGRPKLLLPWGSRGETVVGAVVEALAAGGAGRVALVVGPPADEVAVELAAWGRRRGLTVAANPHPERGMLSSILCGVAALGGADDLRRRNTALLVTPADLPALAPSTVAAVAAALRAGALLAVPLHRGRRGHPLGIASSLLPEIARLELAAGLRQLVARHADALVEVPVDDPGAVHDVDTPDDYRRLAADGGRFR